MVVQKKKKFVNLTNNSYNLIKKLKIECYLIKTLSN